MGSARSQKLSTSNDMVPVEGFVEVDIPADKLWRLFARPKLWPRWNRCFVWAYNTTLVKGEHLLWCFGPIKRWYPYVMPAIANIVELEPGRKVTWEVTALPGFYAHHTYSVDPLPGDRSRFGSWEKATGASFSRMKRFWLAHFNFVKDRSLEGVRALETIYRREGSLYSITEQRDPVSSMKDAALTALSAVAPLWFYRRYVRREAVQLAPGVHAVLGGGGDSLVIENGGEALVVDTKFPPGSDQLAKWVRKNIKSPVTKVVNTHYHYDHTQGNENYPKATIIAHERTPGYMLEQDGDYWNDHLGGLPSAGVSNDRQTVTVGDKTVHLLYPGPAHTRADIVVYLPDYKILAVGDLFFHTYYPFFDCSRAGVAIPGIIESIRRVAKTFPDARVVPGHGPIANISDFQKYAEYLEHLADTVRTALDAGQDEREAVRTIDLSAWNRRVLPSFHLHRLSWGTRENNIRNVYRVLAAEREGATLLSARPPADAGAQ